jgi:hypothetical protein
MDCSVEHDVEHVDEMRTVRQRRLAQTRAIRRTGQSLTLPEGQRTWHREGSGEGDESEWSERADTAKREE